MKSYGDVTLKFRKLYIYCTKDIMACLSRFLEVESVAVTYCEHWKEEEGEILPSGQQGNVVLLLQTDSFLLVVSSLKQVVMIAVIGDILPCLFFPNTVFLWDSLKLTVCYSYSCYSYYGTDWTTIIISTVLHSYFKFLCTHVAV